MRALQYGRMDMVDGVEFSAFNVTQRMRGGLPGPIDKTYQRRIRSEMHDITEQTQVTHSLRIYCGNKVQGLETTHGIQKIGPVETFPASHLGDRIGLVICHTTPTT